MTIETKPAPQPNFGNTKYLATVAGEIVGNGETPELARVDALAHQADWSIWRVLKTGDLAYFDTFAGCIPCKVLSIGSYPNGTAVSGFASSSQHVTFRLTAKRGAYKRGEVLESSALHVIPRDVLRANGWIGTYQVQVDACWSDLQVRRQTKAAPRFQPARIPE